MKTWLWLVMSSRKQKPYFQAHSVIVPTSYPLRQVLQNLESLERLIKWSIKLGQYEISYKPRKAKQSQAVANFIVEFTIPEEGKIIISYINNEANSAQPTSFVDFTYELIIH